MRSWLRWRTPIGTWAIRRQVAGKRLSRGCGDGPLSFSGVLPTNALVTVYPRRDKGSAGSTTATQDSVQAPVQALWSLGLTVHC